MNNMNDPTSSSNENNELATQQEFGVSQDFMLGSPKKKVSTQTVVLVAVLVAGCVLLFGMRKMGMGPALSFAEFKLDYEPSGDSEAERAEIDRLLAALDRTNEPIKLPDGIITRNPFHMEVEEPTQIEVATNVDTGPTDSQIKAMKAAERQQRMDQEHKTFRVQSIMGGRVPLAKISGETYTVGDDIGTYFKIAKIEGRTVTITARVGGDEVYTVSLGGDSIGGRNYNRK